MTWRGRSKKKTQAKRPDSENEVQIYFALKVLGHHFIGWFPNHHYFSRDLSSSKRNHNFFNGGNDFQGLGLLFLFLFLSGPPEPNKCLKRSGKNVCTIQLKNGTTDPDSEKKTGLHRMFLSRVMI